jgi:hypothetical protein
MNVHHSSVRHKLQILSRELFRKQNAGSNHYNSLRSFRLEDTEGIEDTNVSLATASRKDTNAFAILGESVKCFLLVGTELNHRSHFV